MTNRVRSVDPVAADEGGDGAARVVHVGLRKGQRQAAALDPDLGAEGVLLGALEAGPVAGGEEAHGVGPALCREPANSAPGLPRPTPRRSAGVPRRGAWSGGGSPGSAEQLALPAARGGAGSPAPLAAPDWLPPLACGSSLPSPRAGAAPPVLGLGFGFGGSSARSNSMAARLMVARTTGSSAREVGR